MWLNWKLHDAVRCPDAVLEELGTASFQLKFGRELDPIPTVPIDTDNSMDTIEWMFEVASRQLPRPFLVH